MYRTRYGFGRFETYHPGASANRFECLLAACRPCTRRVQWEKDCRRPKHKPHGRYIPKIFPLYHGYIMVKSPWNLEGRRMAGVTRLTRVTRVTSPREEEGSKRCPHDKTTWAGFQTVWRWSSVICLERVTPGKLPTLGENAVVPFYASPW